MLELVEFPVVKGSLSRLAGPLVDTLRSKIVWSPALRGHMTIGSAFLSFPLVMSTTELAFKNKLGLRTPSEFFQLVTLFFLPKALFSVGALVILAQSHILTCTAVALATPQISTRCTVLSNTPQTILSR